MNETLTHEQLNADRATVLGFWVYLMTDLVLFASLFAAFMVLRDNTFGGPSGKDLFDLPFALQETVILLMSSFLSGIALVLAAQGKAAQTVRWLAAAGFFGAWFVFLEVSEFAALAAAGHGPQASAFLSSYFTLVGTHGLHVTIGLVWMIALFVALQRRGLTRHMLRKLALFTIFWHFLDIVWIFIFTIVYLFGML